MDTIYIIVIIVFHLDGSVYGDKHIDDPTDCKNGPKYEACECVDTPINPLNGYIEVANKTYGMYKCDRGYFLNVSAIIRCHNGGKDNQNFWNTSNNACLAIDDCNPNPCLNVDVCIDGIENYTCICLPGFTGKNCSQSITTTTMTMTTSESSTYFITGTDHIVTTTEEGVIILSTSTINTNNTTHTEAQTSSVAISVSISVVLVVLAVTGLVFFLLRCKRKRNNSKQSAFSKDKVEGYTITSNEKRNKSYKETSHDSEYYEIQTYNVDQEERAESEYQTIDTSPDYKITRESSYDHLDNKANVHTSNTYSHISVISTNGGHLNDSTYSHIHNTNDAEDEDSYNRLMPMQILSNIHVKTDDIDDKDADYNNIKTTPCKHVDETDTYHHLNTT